MKFSGLALIWREWSSSNKVCRTTWFLFQSGALFVAALSVPALGLIQSLVQLILCSVTARQKRAEREAGDLFLLPRFMMNQSFTSFVSILTHGVQGCFYSSSSFLFSATTCLKSICSATSVGGMGLDDEFVKWSVPYLLLRHYAIFHWKTNTDNGLILEPETSRTRNRNSVCSKVHSKL